MKYIKYLVIWMAVNCTLGCENNPTIKPEITECEEIEPLVESNIKIDSSSIYIEQCEAYDYLVQNFDSLGPKYNIRFVPYLSRQMMTYQQDFDGAKYTLDRNDGCSWNEHLIIPMLERDSVMKLVESWAKSDPKESSWNKERDSFGPGPGAGCFFKIRDSAAFTVVHWFCGC